MIYSPFGEPVMLTAYCGKHERAGFRYPVCLVRCRYEDGSEGHHYMANLRADDGPNEIEKAVDALPEVVLTGKELKAALSQAD